VARFGKLRKQPTFTGVVVMARFREGERGGYGFIRRDDGGEDVWFNLFATRERILENGTKVKFVLSQEKFDIGERAHRVWVRAGMEIETENGGNEDGTQQQTSAKDEQRAREEAASWGAHWTAQCRA
jgi:cold shock CspA family protein